MAATHIPMKVDILDKAVPVDRRIKYSKMPLTKIIVLLQQYRISYSPSGRFFENVTANPFSSRG
jgi:hypothetical protein